jgi:Halobacterial output domain 1
METESTPIGNEIPADDTPRSLTNQILTAIAESTHRSVEDLGPLYDVIDPEALDALFARRADGSPRPVGKISFQYAGYWVTVSSDGAVEIDLEKG